MLAHPRSSSVVHPRSSALPPDRRRVRDSTRRCRDVRSMAGAPPLLRLRIGRSGCMRIWAIRRGIPVMALLLATCSQVAPPSAMLVSNGAVRILLAGDVMLGRGVAEVAASDPFGVFGDIQAEVQSA